MEVDTEEKGKNNGGGIFVDEPSEIFYCRGMNKVHGHGLDPMLFSTVKLMIRDVNEAKIINASKFCNQSNEIMPCMILLSMNVIVKKKEKYTLFTLDDSTGCIDCKLWSKCASNKNENAKWNIGDWVKMEGKLNYFMDRREINIICMDRIIDPNEELMHWLECKNIRQNVLKKPMKFRIEPPMIQMSNEANALLQILYDGKIQKFQFKELLSHVGVRKVMMKNAKKKETKNECLLRLRNIIRELARLKKVKLIDLNKDVYVTRSS